MEPSIAAVRNSFSMRTGVACLRSLPPSVLLDLAMQRLPSAVLTTPLVHEIVHHAFANSAVNIALQYRWLELLRLNLSSPGFGYAVYDDHVALAADLAATEAVFQPFAEGIANFAEFEGNLATLAAAGICASFATTRPELEPLMQLAGYGLQDALEMSERVKQESGVTLIRAEGNRIQVRI